MPSSGYPTILWYKIQQCYRNASLVCRFSLYLVVCTLNGQTKKHMFWLPASRSLDVHIQRVQRGHGGGQVELYISLAKRKISGPIYLHVSSEMIYIMILMISKKTIHHSPIFLPNRKQPLPFHSQLSLRWNHICVIFLLSSGYTALQKEMGEKEKKL